MKHRPFSGRQIALLQMLDNLGVNGHVTITEAQTLNQTTFSSALIRGYCVYRATGPNRGFHVTKEGVEALHDFHSADVTRKNPTLPLTSYFDPTAYGLSAPSLKKKQPEKAAKAPRGPAPRDNVRAFISHQKSA